MNKEECEKVINNGNTILVYGMSKEKIDKQMKCKHENWHGPGIDEISRYYKCKDCYCLKRDISLEEYIKACEN